MFALSVSTDGIARLFDTHKIAHHRATVDYCCAFNCAKALFEI